MTQTKTPPPSDYPWRRFFSAFWRLARPYWTSEEKWSAWGLLSLTVSLVLLILCSARSVAENP